MTERNPGETPASPVRDPAAELAALVEWALANPMAVGELETLRAALGVGRGDSRHVIEGRIGAAFARQATGEQGDRD